MKEEMKEKEERRRENKEREDVLMPFGVTVPKIKISIDGIVSPQNLRGTLSHFFSLLLTLSHSIEFILYCLEFEMEWFSIVKVILVTSLSFSFV